MAYGVLGLHETRHNADLKAFLRSDGGTLGDPAELPWCGDYVHTCLRLGLPAETFPGRVAEWTGVDAERVHAVEIDEAPDWQGKPDAVLTFRGMHGLAREDLADETIAHFYGLLKPGGLVGVVQHRASEDAPYDYPRGHNGYLKQSEVIAMFESEGFELVKDADINANPKDTADHDGGVWSLPPTLRHGDKDKNRYLAIGESDRMTLVFRKPV